MGSKIVCFEGIDKAGKTTQSRLLEQELIKKELDTVVMEFPDRENVTGKMLNHLLLNRHDYIHQFFHILMSANRWENAKIIEGHLTDGRVVIMNRYFQSNLIYGVVNGLNPAWLNNLDEGLPKPTLVIILEIDPEVSFKREVVRDNFEAKIEIMKRAAELYREYGEPLGWKFIKGNRDILEIAKDVLKTVEEIL